MPPLISPAAIEVFTHVITRGPVPRVEIARATGLSFAAVTKAIAPLIEAGYVREHGSARVKAGTAGRPVNPLSVVDDAGLLAGIKINPGELIGVITGLTAEVRREARADLTADDPATVIDAIRTMITELTAGLDHDRLLGLGVAVSGDVDGRAGVVRESVRLGWRDLPLAARLREVAGIPVVVENDVRALTLAEHWFGVGLDTTSFAIITIGTGIGCGLHLNGDVVEGAFGVAGEIGHLPLGDPDLTCSCGRRACLETVASSAAILTSIRNDADHPELTWTEALRRAHQGDPAAVAAFARAGSAIGRAMATVVNLVGPEVIQVVGEGVADFDLYEDRMRAAFHDHVFGAAERCRIGTRSHSFTDWARGAAVALLRSVVRNGTRTK
ncbi:ROK family protein [Microlunatus sp. GCM10028923]|uniref:ROK family protein n=1 Tax=Microlunatus sp. GCM10028923 TaxID=3273400 RepID=UPI00361EB59A